jgi:predicted amino acid dehydrogenase
MLDEADVSQLMAHLPQQDGLLELLDSVRSKPTMVVTFEPSRQGKVDTPCDGNSKEVFAAGPVHARPMASSSRFAWLFHLVDAHDVTYLEPRLTQSSTSERIAFLQRIAPLAEPVVMPSTTIRGATGCTAQLLPILLPVTSAWLKQQFEAGRRRPVSGLLNRALRVAEALNADLISLGQFTSIVSRHGRDLTAGQMGLTTGNSYTAALIVEAVRRGQLERGIAAATSTLAIVGAMGNIGRVCAEILAPEYRRVILVGRNRQGARHQLQSLASRLRSAQVTCDPHAIKHAHVVVCVTNGVEAMLGPEHFQPEALICDASVPPTVLPETTLLRPDLTLLRGGIVRLPCGERLSIPGFPLPPGMAFGCLAEGAILSFEGICDASYTGRLSIDKVAHLADLAARHGFEPAVLKTDSAPPDPTSQRSEICKSASPAASP